MPDSTTISLPEAIAAKPRMSLAQLPTPLQEAPRLSERLGVRVLIKRDDLTGLALGGNKARKLEFLIADALDKGADTVVTTGGSQSNHARMTAAACRRAGLDCYLVLDRGVHPELQGNLLLDRLLGARVEFVESADPAEATQAMDRLADRLRAGGRRPYIIPRGGSVPVGATGYAAFVPELLDQLAQSEERPSALYIGTGSTGTHSGILAGLAALRHPVRLQGVSVSRNRPEQEAKILALTNATLDYLGIPEQVGEEHIHVDDRFVGRGYGYPTEATMEAIELLARDEGIVLDPVYTGKAMSGLVQHTREGAVGPDDTVVFLHTGGSPALFAYHAEVLGAVEAR